MTKGLEALVKGGKIMEALAYPFYKEMPDGSLVPDIKWLPDHVVRDGIECIPYISGDQVKERLNSVLGLKWQDVLEKHEGMTICKLSLLIDGQWADRSDVGTAKKDSESTKRPIKEKAEATDSLKRAAKCWGVGEYLNSIPNVVLPTKRDNGKNVPCTHDGNTLLMGDDLHNYINTLSVPMGKLMEFWSSLSPGQQQSLKGAVVEAKKLLTEKPKKDGTGK
jgi:hypothetical protein